MQLEDVVDLYFDELKELDEFKRLIILKKEIDQKYHNLIISFKTSESIYEESKTKGYLNSKIKQDFMISKTRLYEKDEVKEYLELERKINKILNEDFNKLKESISNKFTKKELFEF